MMFAVLLDGKRLATFDLILVGLRKLLLDE